jgi:hypothetical protein
MAISRIISFATDAFRTRNAELPVNLTILAKLFVIIFWAKFGWRGFDYPFLPFVSFFDQIPFPTLWLRGLQLTALICSLMIILNYRIRAACFVLGLTVLVGILAARLSYSNNRLLFAFVMMLVGLYKPDRRLDFLRLQMGFLYFGAAFNKILDPAWRSGLFFENWSSVLGHTWYASLATFFPPLTLSMLVCWAVIVIEFILAAAWCSGRFRSPLIWIGAPFHMMLSFYMGASFGMFFHLAPVCYFILAEWPKNPIEVHYPDNRTSWARVHRFFERIDVDRFFRWSPVPQVRDAHQSGSESQTNLGTLSVGIGGKNETGFHALRLLVLYSPLTWFVLCVLVLAFTPKGVLSVATYILCISGLFLFSRLFDPIGQRIVDWIIARPPPMPITIP